MKSLETTTGNISTATYTLTTQGNNINLQLTPNQVYLTQTNPVQYGYLYNIGDLTASQIKLTSSSPNVKVTVADELLNGQRVIKVTYELINTSVAPTSNAVLVTAKNPSGQTETSTGGTSQNVNPLPVPTPNPTPTPSPTVSPAPTFPPEPVVYDLAPRVATNLTPMTFTNNSGNDVTISSISTDNPSVTIAPNGDLCTSAVVANGNSCEFTLWPQGLQSVTPVVVTFHFSDSTSKTFVVNANNTFTANCSLNGGRYILINYIWGNGDFDIAAGFSSVTSTPTVNDFPLFSIPFTYGAGSNCVGYSCNNDMAWDIYYPGSNLLFAGGGDTYYADVYTGQENLYIDTWNLPSGTTSFNFATMGNWYNELGDPTIMSIKFSVYPDGTNFNFDDSTYLYVPDQSSISSCSSSADVTWWANDDTGDANYLSSTDSGLQCNYSSPTIAGQANNGSCQFTGIQ